MSGKRVRRIICAAAPRGSVSAIEQLCGLADEENAEAIAVVGDLGSEADRRNSYRSIFDRLGHAGLPAFWIPGPEDAPVDGYLREAYNFEIVHPQLHGVHGTAVRAGQHVVFAGMGGEINDDPDSPREEIERLSYPRWEAVYRLKVVRELGEHPLVLMSGSPPAHKGRHTPGSEAVAELIATLRPRIAICGGEPGVVTLGRTVVVAPGELAEGQYALADLQERDARLERLAATA
jgi:Icc-related predicted phosphoesterase